MENRNFTVCRKKITPKLYNYLLKKLHCTMHFVMARHLPRDQSTSKKGHTRENPLDYIADKKGRICDLSDFSEKYIKRLTFV